MSHPNPSTTKIKIHFVAVGSAPILKRSKFQIPSDTTWARLGLQLRRMLWNSTTNTTTPLFLYCQAAFVPSPEESLASIVQTLFHHNNNPKQLSSPLIVHYSLQEAWG